MDNTVETQMDKVNETQMDKVNETHVDNTNKTRDIITKEMLLKNIIKTSEYEYYLSPKRLFSYHTKHVNLNNLFDGKSVNCLKVALELVDNDLISPSITKQYNIMKTQFKYKLVLRGDWFLHIPGITKRDFIISEGDLADKNLLVPDMILLTRAMKSVKIDLVLENIGHLEFVKLKVYGTSVDFNPEIEENISSHQSTIFKQVLINEKGLYNELVISNNNAGVYSDTYLTKEMFDLITANLTEPIKKPKKTVRTDDFSGHETKINNFKGFNIYHKSSDDYILKPLTCGYDFSCLKISGDVTSFYFRTVAENAFIHNYKVWPFSSSSLWIDSSSDYDIEMNGLYEYLKSHDQYTMDAINKLLKIYLVNDQLKQKCELTFSVSGDYIYIKLDSGQHVNHTHDANIYFHLELKTDDENEIMRCKPSTSSNLHICMNMTAYKWNELHKNKFKEHKCFINLNNL